MMSKTITGLIALFAIITGLIWWFSGSKTKRKPYLPLHTVSINNVAINLLRSDISGIYRVGMSEYEIRQNDVVATLLASNVRTAEYSIPFKDTNNKVGYGMPANGVSIYQQSIRRIYVDVLQDYPYDQPKAVTNLSLMPNQDKFGVNAWTKRVHSSQEKFRLIINDEPIEIYAFPASRINEDEQLTDAALMGMLRPLLLRLQSGYITLYFARLTPFQLDHPVAQLPSYSE